MFKNKLVTAVVGALFSMPAWANIDDTQGWNLGAGVAASYHQYDSSIDDVLFSAHLSAGYRFNEYFGIEGRLGKGFTEIELTDYNLMAEQGIYYAGYLKTMYPLASNFTPYLLLGAQNSEIVIEPNSTTDTSFSYGVGLSYRLKAKTVAVDVGVEALSAFSHGDIDYDIWDFGLKVGYQF